MGEGAVLFCRVLGPREVGEERYGKKNLHFAFQLPSLSGIDGRGPAPFKSRELVWGKIDTPIRIFPQLTELLSRVIESISILSHIMTLFCISIMKA